MALSAYEKLHSRQRDVSLLGSTAEVLGWDQETCLPDSGVAWRAEQLAFLQGQKHRLATAPEVADWLSEAEAGPTSANPVEATNLRWWRRHYERAVRLPVDLVEEFTRATALAQSVWAQARKDSNFSLFQPHLEKLVELTRQRADAWGWEVCRYDALLEGYEPGARSAELSQLFSELAPQISALVTPAREHSQRWPAETLAGEYPIAAQQAFNREIAEAVGFDFTAGRIDTATHPFCTALGPQDVRLTTRYNEKDFTTSLFGVLHEAGHGLYDQGLNVTEWGQPAGSSLSLVIHVSQSRLWANYVG